MNSAASSAVAAPMVKRSNGSCATPGGAVAGSWTRFGPHEMGDNHVFEMFQRNAPGEQLVHVGDIEAPDVEAALFFAKEHLLRREPAEALWIVDRRDVHEATWPADVLNSGSLKRYRRTPGRTGRSGTTSASSSARDERSTT
ncbi:hypothetical protein EEB14_45740 [Rhodococcus sp. WS4]|nr:hypothetical protein EEB14_45740 [Rhodococcus sp. WS4]